MAVNFCLPDSVVAQFKKKLRDGTLAPAKLLEMTTEQRRKAFEEVVGADAAVEVNRRFEEKILLVNKEQGIINWIKEVSGIDQEKKDALAERVRERYAEKKRRMLNPRDEEAFLGELVSDYYSRKNKIEVTLDEAEKITELYSKAETLKAKADENGRFETTEDRLKYGWAHVNYLDYVAELKLKGTQSPVLEVLTSPTELTTRMAGAAKSIVASLDNSFFGRQGIKVLFNSPGSWTKAFMKSWGDFAKGLVKIDATKAIRAEIYSRPNALNGKYAAGGGYDLGVISEEAYPSSLPERIPILGRLFKGSENAFNGGALRLRADFSDKMIALAEKNDVDVYDKEQAAAIASLAGSMTGRAKLGKAQVYARELNVLLFSIKFVTSNVHTLTGHRLDKRATKFTKKQASRQLLRIIVGLAGILATADALGDDDAVDWDPRSSGFGKIKVGNTRFDVSGGMASLVTLAARIAPTRHKGEWGFWRKSTTTGSLTKSESGWGSYTALDTVLDYGLGKLSPVASILRDTWRQEMFGGKPLTTENIIKGLRPIAIQNYEEFMNDPNSAPVLSGMILDSLGVGSNTYGAGTDWNGTNTKELIQLKEKIGQKQFNEANKKYNERLDKWNADIESNGEWQSLTQDEKAKVRTKIKREIKDRVFDEYGFTYEPEDTEEIPDLGYTL